jgi:hypothetical protein
MARLSAYVVLSFVVVLALFIASERAFSPSFNQCIARPEAEKEAAQDKEGPAPFGGAIGAYARCSGEFIEANRDSIAAFATLVIAAFTCTLWLTGASQLRHSREVDRAYLVGGGDCVRDAQDLLVPDRNGNRQFRVEVGNHGKTPAILYAFEIDFCTQIDATGRKRPDLPSRPHHDQFSPGEKHRRIGPLLSITRSGDDVVFGAFHYLDVWGKQHSYRFIFRIDAKDGRTYSDLRNVDSYRGST